VSSVVPEAAAADPGATKARPATSAIAATDVDALDRITCRERCMHPPPRLVVERTLSPGPDRTLEVR
jgi:hypothetical protein